MAEKEEVVRVYFPMAVKHKGKFFTAAGLFFDREEARARGKKIKNIAEKEVLMKSYPVKLIGKAGHFSANYITLNIWVIYEEVR